MGLDDNSTINKENFVGESLVDYRRKGGDKPLPYKIRSRAFIVLVLTQGQTLLYMQKIKNQNLT